MAENRRKNKSKLQANKNTLIFSNLLLFWIYSANKTHSKPSEIAQNRQILAWWYNCPYLA